MGRVVANKTKPTKLSMKAFIDALPDPIRRADAKSLITMMQSVTGEKPKMFGASIIGFGTFPLRLGKRARGRHAASRFFPAQSRDHSL